MVMLMLLVLAAHLFQQLVSQRHLLNGGEDGLAADLIPGGGEDGGVGIFVPQQLHSGVQLLLAELLGAGEDDGAGGFHLIVVELTEVLHVDLHLAGVHHGNGTAQHHGAFALLHGLFHSHDHIAELAHAGGLDEHTVRVKLGHHILEGLGKITHQRAADAARGHFGDLHAAFLEEAAVDADLAKLVFDEDDLLVLVDLTQQLFDERGLAGA